VDAPPPIRFLLDQGFPKPPSGLDVAQLDRSAVYTHVSDAFPALVLKVSTPDWLLYVAAAEAGFDAFVCRDLHQFEQREEMVALMMCGLTMITWTKPIEDPVAEWGQLLAYGPQLVKAMRAPDYAPAIFQLPAPRLASVEKHRVRARVGEMASEGRKPTAEHTALALQTMRGFLTTTEHKGQARLLAPFDRMSSSLHR
jgi:hypothetical protein